MNKILLTLFTLIHFSFSATHEQVEQYIIISKSDSDLIEMEQMIEEITPSSTKNSQTITIRFKDYLEKNFTEREITELIRLYKNPLLLTLRELDSDLPEEELREFNLSLQENPLSTERLHLNQQILKNMFDDEDLKNMIQGFDKKLFETFEPEERQPLLTKKDENSFVKDIREELTLPLLYNTQTLNMDELNELQELTNTALIKKANKIELDATMYAIEDFMQEMITGIMDSFMEEGSNNSPLLESFLEG
jgi:hypothetical protein